MGHKCHKLALKWVVGSFFGGHGSEAQKKCRFGSCILVMWRSGSRTHLDSTFKAIKKNCGPKKAAQVGRIQVKPLAFLGNIQKVYCFIMVIMDINQIRHQPFKFLR